VEQLQKERCCGGKFPQVSLAPLFFRAFDFGTKREIVISINCFFLRCFYKLLCVVDKFRRKTFLYFFMKVKAQVRFECELNDDSSC
jgi:hypothetical protein